LTINDDDAAAADDDDSNFNLLHIDTCALQINGQTDYLLRL